jgi:hypothetical protein
MVRSSAHFSADGRFFHGKYEVHGSQMKHLSTTALRQPHNLLRSATGSNLLWVAALSSLAL